MMEEFWFDFRQEQEIFSLVRSFRTWGSLSILLDGHQQLFSPGTKRPKCELTAQLQLVPRLRINGAIHSATHTHTTSCYAQRYIYQFVTCGWYRHNRTCNYLRLCLW
jgi:hypothetical protein